ncbi:MAG: hypothetical protein K9J18_00270 [Crocinitomicaceae bacterium]|nr:hypothetical protein [Crocinitomicaceae bacterium]
MVSLERKINYLNRIGESPKLSAVNQLLNGLSIAQPSENDLSETDEIYFGIISAIQANNKSEFEKYYSKKSKSNPSKDSPAPFVNDDFLIFSIILGVSKFSIDKVWIKNIVSIRSKNSITTTLENLLVENYYSTSNIHEIVFMYFQQINQSLITNDFLNTTFNRINENTALFDSKSDFQILCAIHAYNSILQLKEAPSGSEQQLLKLFDESFVKKMKVLSWLLQLGFLFGLCYGMLQLPLYSPEVIKKIEDYGYIFNLIGALGITLLGNQLNIIKIKTHELTMRLFGYPKGLIKINKDRNHGI